LIKMKKKRTKLENFHENHKFTYNEFKNSLECDPRKTSSNFSILIKSN